MTAIDTSKLKDKMFCKFKYRGKSYEGKIEIDQHGFKVLSDPWYYIADREGRIASHITELVFPDLQEQDRMEAWEPKPGEEVRGKKLRESLDQAEIIWVDGKLIHKQKGINDVFYLLQDGLGSFHLCVAVKPIPKPDPGGELREILVKIADHFEKAKDVADGMLIDRSISQIKSLLAAKGPNVTKEQFEAKWKQLSENRGIAFEVDSAYETFKFFTKNETK